MSYQIIINTLGGKYSVHLFNKVLSVSLKLDCKIIVTGEVIAVDQSHGGKPYEARKELDRFNGVCNDFVAAIA
jgi:hypothetical protein